MTPVVIMQLLSKIKQILKSNSMHTFSLICLLPKAVVQRDQFLQFCLPENIKIQDKAVFQLNFKENQSH